MNEYEQILRKAKEQGLDFDGKNIVVPITENKFMFNGELLFGRNFGSIMYVLRDVELWIVMRLGFQTVQCYTVQIFILLNKEI